MTEQNRKRKAPSSTNNFVDRLCRQRQIPPGSIAIKNSRTVHGKPGSKNPPPQHTQKNHPPPIQTTKTPLPTQPSPSIQTKLPPPPTHPPPPIQTNPTTPSLQPPSKTRKNQTPPPSQPASMTQTNPTPPSLQPPSKTRKNQTPPPSQPASTTQTNPTPPLIQTSPTPPYIDQPQPSISTSEEFRFIPTPGYTHHVLQSPPHHTTEEDVQEEGDQALSNDEQQEQDDGQRPKIYIVEDTNALSPSNLVAEMCRKVIVKLYRGTFYNYSELKRDNREAERKEWFNTFKSLVSWDRCDDAKMEGLFHQRCATRLRDILQKAKDQARKPPWMGVDTWTFLLAKWKTKEFKDVSKQNKINRSSSRGGAVHTSGRIAHHDVALELAKKLKRPAHPDELFIATHKKKNGAWVDDRAARTHETYVSSLTQATQTGDDVDGSTRIYMWKEAAGGKTRGRCYGAAQLARNVRYGVSFLTQVSITNPNREADSQAIEAARAEAVAAREEAARANARTDELAKQFEVFQQQVFDMLQSREAGPSSAPSSGHPDYSFSEDEEDDADDDHDQDQ